MKQNNATEWLFFHQWKKNPDTSASCPGILIPDTLLYRWAKPYYWYYTEEKGMIERKTKEKIHLNVVSEMFNKNTSKLPVIAYYLKPVEKKLKSGEEIIEFEYCNSKEFEHLIYQREKNLNCAIQKFIEPKNLRNSLIKVQWCPQFCIIVRKTNVHKMDNRKIPIEQRVSTFEGPDHLSVSESQNSPLQANEIEKICSNIVKHIGDVSGGNVQISRMTLYFKNDEENRLWLLFCSRLRVRDNATKGKDNVLSPRLRLAKTNDFPNEEDFFKNIGINQNIVNLRVGGTIQKELLNKTKVVEPMEHCPSCLKQEGLQYDLHFRNLIETFLGHDNKQENLDFMRKFPPKIEKSYAIKKIKRKDDETIFNENIPALMQWLWGQQKDQKYEALIHNPSWMNLNIKVCYKCFFEFTELAVTNNMASSGTTLLQDIVKKRTLGVKDQNIGELKILLSKDQHPQKVHTVASKFSQNIFRSNANLYNSNSGPDNGENTIETDQDDFNLMGISQAIGDAGDSKDSDNSSPEIDIIKKDQIFQEVSQIEPGLKSKDTSFLKPMNIKNYDQTHDEQMALPNSNNNIFISNFDQNILQDKRSGSKGDFTKDTTISESLQHLGPDQQKKFAKMMFKKYNPYVSRMKAGGVISGRNNVTLNHIPADPLFGKNKRSHVRTKSNNFFTITQQGLLDQKSMKRKSSAQYFYRHPSLGPKDFDMTQFSNSKPVSRQNSRLTSGTAKLKSTFSEAKLDYNTIKQSMFELKKYQKEF